MDTIKTIGHSTHSLEVFLELLKKHNIEIVADVRTVPKSRHVPQFNVEIFPDSLYKEKIGYIHLPELGGFRHAKKDSINTGWRNMSFRGYADYMQTDEFFCGLDMLMNLAERHHVAIMCAEALPHKCHRSLIADALLAKGAKVFHIMSDGKAIEHRMTNFARVENGRVFYPHIELR